MNVKEVIKHESYSLSVKRVVAFALATVMALSGIQVGFENKQLSLSTMESLAASFPDPSAAPELIIEADTWKAPEDGKLGFYDGSKSIQRKDSSYYLGFIFCEDPNNIESVTLDGFTASLCRFNGYALLFMNVVINANYVHDGTITVKTKDGKTYSRTIGLIGAVLAAKYRASSWPRYSSYVDFSTINYDIYLDVSNPSDLLELYAYTPHDKYGGDDPYQSMLWVDYGGTNYSFKDIYVDGHKLVRGQDYNIEMSLKYPGNLPGMDYMEFAGASTWRTDCTKLDMNYTGKVFCLKAVLNNSYLKTLVNGHHAATMVLNDGTGYSLNFAVQGSTAVEVKDELPKLDTKNAEYDGDAPADVDLSVSLGSGTVAATDITEIRIGDRVLNSEEYSFDREGSLILKNDMLSEMANGEYKVFVKFNNTEETIDEGSLIIKNNEEYPDIYENDRVYDNDAPKNVNYPVYLGKGVKKSR